MVGCVIFNYGVGVDLDFACDDSDNIGTWNVVCVGGRFVVFGWGYILPVAENAFFARVVAFVCDWWVGMFLFCGIVRQYYRFPDRRVFDVIV